MDIDNNNFEFNNPAPAPLPKPLPQLQNNKKAGGFDGAANRFCSDIEPEPVENMPDFAIGINNSEKIYNLGNSENKKRESSNSNSSNKSDFEEQNGNSNSGLGSYNNPVYQQTFDNSPFAQKNETYGANRAFRTTNTNKNTNGNNETIGKFYVPEKSKKTSPGLIIFISVIAVMAIMTGVFFTLSVSTGKQNSSTDNPFENLYPQESSSVEETYPSDYNSFYQNRKKEGQTVPKTEKNSKDITNSKWKGITLENLPKSKKDYSAQKAYEKVSKSTVAVLCFVDKVKDEKYADGQGTGIVISKDGYIVTNSHVIGNSKSQYIYQIVDNNGKKFSASVVGYDTRTDIAVLKAEKGSFTPVSFGKTSLLSIGDDIIAVGNPGGLNFQNSLTKGIVSAKDRTLTDSNVTYIQTDAAVNPGNSGGPICNLYGQAMGITTAKIDSSLYEGMGFAIPSETVKKIADDIIRQGYVSNRVRIGIVGSEINVYAAEEYGVPQGIMITEISDNGSLAGTKAQEGDILTKLDGKNITSFDLVYKILEKHKPGDKVKAQLYRVDEKNPSKGKSYTITITLVADKGETQS